uniref:Reverse transcriptase domain-containing protein n=1 Tax=Heliothis virescens TaxID=7102 RepID=A0A2A4JF59_HELVI
MMPRNNRYFKLGFLNAGSLGTGHDDLLAAFENDQFDIMAINETWLRAGEEGRAPRVPGYRLRHAPRPASVRSGRGGGVGFYLRRGLSARTWNSAADPRFDSVEQMWLTLSMNGKKIAVGTAYRPPWLDLDLFIDAITDTISTLGQCDSFILVGDFNVNMLASNDAKTKKVIEFLQYFGLTQMVNSPTHFTGTSETLIDLMCTDLRAVNTSVEAFGSFNGHSIVVSEFNIRRTKAKPYVCKYRAFKNICADSFNADLSLLNTESMSCISTLANVNDMVYTFSQCIMSLFDTHAPVKTCTIKEITYPWITDNIKLMMRLRDKALANYRDTKSEAKKDYYKQFKSLVESSLWNEKVAYYNYNINNKIKDPTLLWKNIKSTVTISTERQDLPSHLNDANSINSHFLNVPGDSVASAIQHVFFRNNKFGEAIFTLNTVLEDEISRVIKTIKSNAEGHDCITLTMLNLTLPQTLPVITHIINCSIVSSTFPDQWKIALVKPLPKTTNPTDVKDLRPISILPCLSKVLEKVICRQLTQFLEDNHILPELQSGFRKRRGTATALLDVTDNILGAQDKGMCTLMVLLDFSRAFDAINVSLLLSKLNYYGFDDAATKWFESYLTNRRQQVKLSLPDGTTLTSALTSVDRGVPQGSILGPVLFTLYCADIVKYVKKCKYHIYADDVQLYISFKPDDYEKAINDLNEDLHRIAVWSKDNCLTLNPVKIK